MTKTILAAVAALTLLCVGHIFALEQGDDNPTGVSGVFNGNVGGGSYDPYTGNAKRTVDDLVVPGCVGSYPLKVVKNLQQSYHLFQHQGRTMALLLH